MALWDWSLDPFWGDPWPELERVLRRMNRLARAPTGVSLRQEFPAVNAWFDEEKAVVTCEIPGVRREDLHVAVDNEVLTIRGSRRPQELKQGARPLRQERGGGGFIRSVKLPFACERGKVEAFYENGVLKLVLPRSQAEKPRTIEIKG